MHIGRGQFLRPDHKLARNWASPGARAPISKFWDPLDISQTEKAMIFKFGTHIGKHVGLRSAGAGAYCGGHLAAQLVTCTKFAEKMSLVPIRYLLK